MNEVILELIGRRRRQILVHSCIYYRYNDNIISDYDYDKWSNELAALQKEYPAESAAAVYADDFADYDGTTGFDLPYANTEIVTVAERLLLRKGKH